jgi:hypothetical protein
MARVSKLDIVVVLGRTPQNSYLQQYSFPCLHVKWTWPSFLELIELAIVQYNCRQPNYEAFKHSFENIFSLYLEHIFIPAHQNIRLSLEFVKMMNIDPNPLQSCLNTCD